MNIDVKNQTSNQQKDMNMTFKSKFSLDVNFSFQIKLVSCYLTHTTGRFTKLADTLATGPLPHITL